MEYGKKLVETLEAQIASYQKAISDRYDRINEGLTDIDDCFISHRCEERGINNARDKIDLIKRGGCAWFAEYATMDGELINAVWCDTRYGYKLRAEMPDGSVVWTSASTPAGLAKRGIKAVECLRPAWYAFKSSQRGMLGVYSGNYVLFPSDVNYATGEPAPAEPLEIRDAS